jgi:hypothetical protein
MGAAPVEEVWEGKVRERESIREAHLIDDSIIIYKRLRIRLTGRGIVRAEYYLWAKDLP